MQKDITINEITSVVQNSDRSTKNRVFEVTTNVEFSAEEVEECLSALGSELEYSKSEITPLDGTSKQFKVILS